MYFAEVFVNLKSKKYILKCKITSHFERFFVKFGIKSAFLGPYKAPSLFYGVKIRVILRGHINRELWGVATLLTYLKNVNFLFFRISIEPDAASSAARTRRPTSWCWNESCWPTHVGTSRLATARASTCWPHLSLKSWTNRNRSLCR